MRPRSAADRLGVPARLALFAVVLVAAFGAGAALGAALPDLHGDERPAVAVTPAGDGGAPHSTHDGGDR